MNQEFLKIKNHNDLAAFFGGSYKALGKFLYRLDNKYKYKSFLLHKKSGGHRKIDAPRKALKELQAKLSTELYNIYSARPSAHGFVRTKSIVTNAQRHLDKKYVFNIDLLDFFGSIHFGRIKNLFMSKPFSFNHSVATILAQLCCYENKLPQGAPTSPILTNMICWKMDAQLQNLAKLTNSTYTRYVDDITFSFTCSKRRLPEEVVMLRDDEAAPGHALTEIILRNGFEINYDKVRLSGSGQCKEVTGIIVNEFPNVRRRYVRQLSAMLNAWKKYGYEAAEKEFNNKFDTRQRASDVPKSLFYVVKGKLAFLRNVRGGRDPIFQKLAIRFNELVDDDSKKFLILQETTPDQIAIESLWVIESCYDDENEDVIVSQGTGFVLNGFGLITCAHVVTNKGQLIEPIEAYKCTDTTVRYNLKVTHLDTHRDIAICTIDGMNDLTSISLFNSDIKHDLKGRLLGFPAYKFGQSHYICDTKVASTYTQSGIKKFEIDTQIREGNSGGPIISTEGNLMGVALEGAKKDSGNNAVLMYSELKHVLADEYKI